MSPLRFFLLTVFGLFAFGGFVILLAWFQFWLEREGVHGDVVQVPHGQEARN